MIFTENNVYGNVLGKIIIPQEVLAKISGTISRGVKEINLSEEGNLSFILTDGTEILLGNIKGAQGTPGFSPVVNVSPIEGGNRVTITDEQGAKVFDVMDGKDAEGGVDFETDETLSLVNGVLSVNRAFDLEADNTLPITSAAVYETVGNIEILLGTI